RVEIAPERVVLRIAPVLPGGEPPLVPIGEGAVRGVSSEIGAEPSLLRRTEAAAADVGAVGVEGDQVPAGTVRDRQVPAVVAAEGAARLGSEVVEVTGRVVGVGAVEAVRVLCAHVFVVPGRGMGDRL